ncbi:MAG: type IX secretion system protein PorQ [Bacteroidetes bacterium]|nr:type IX secretion system protein PorQ [Bacteroidota bacterium]
MKFVLTACFLWLHIIFTYGQTLGGKSAYSFFKLQPSPVAAASGGINVSLMTDEASMGFQNPAMLSNKMHGQLAANFNSLYAGLSHFSLFQAYSHKKLNTNFGLGLVYLNYGNLVETDVAGNEIGALRPRDFVIQLSAARQYLNKWNYGATVKMIHSNYGVVRSSALAADVGIRYTDTSRLLQMSLVAMNMGVVLKSYVSGQPEELPFDVVFGISKKLEKAPVQFSFTAHHLHRFNLLYEDSLFSNAIGAPRSATGKFSFENIFRHFIIATQINLSKYIEVNAGYNFMRRKELGIFNVPKGLVGFSLGVGALFPKLQIRYARTYMQNTTGYNQLGINLPLARYR